MSAFFKLLDLNPYREEKLEEGEFLKLLQAEPELASRKYKFDTFDDDSLFPLHMICALGASADCVKACYKAYPAATELCTEDMGFPVHFATAFDAAVDVVHYLAKKDPSALEHANSQGKTPLHLACESEFASPDVVIFLTERCAKAAEMKDKEGNTPLNLACRAEQPVLAKIEDLTEGTYLTGNETVSRDSTLTHSFPRSPIPTRVLVDITHSLRRRGHGPGRRRKLALVEHHA